MTYFRDYYPPKSTPLKARGGIRAQSTRGSFGASWWSKRWIEVLESFHLGARLTRGRSYARRGQVLSINIAKGVVSASVQGSRSTPYKVDITIKEVAESDWKKLSDTVFSQAFIASKLLAGQMPDELEQHFKSVGVSLFPQKYDDLKTNCSCPDWSNPCKHIAAVYYLLAEEFDRSPFVLLTLRGISQEKLLQHLGVSQTPALMPGFIEECGGGGNPRRTDLKDLGVAGEVSLEPDDAAEAVNAAKQVKGTGKVDDDPANNAVVNVSLDHKSFWGSPTDKTTHAVMPLTSMRSSSAALTKQLGSVPFWRAEENFQTVMERIYTAASRNALSVFLEGAHRENM